jgi:cellulose synthase/poly-beta-1,6-N-acetylglucosamine synthase-like glycosyltransferase
METLPSVTVIIPARPDQPQVQAAEAARLLDYPTERLEILLARGRQPSVQRNTALRQARGEILYFLDDDSLPGRQNLRRIARHFADPKVQMAGGPNVCPGSAPALEQVFARVLASWLAFGPSRARYAPVGSLRDSSEKELILCNLAARRSSLVELGGFDEALYPNEENALMDELQRRGGRLVYDPELLVERRPRQSLRAFIRMLMTYGRGRAEQFRLHPTPGSALNFVPPIFCVYLLAWWWLPAVLKWGLGAYAATVVAQVLVLAAQKRPLQSLAAAPLIVASHIFYGLGFWRGLFTRLAKPSDPDAQRAPLGVIIERVKV